MTQAVVVQNSLHGRVAIVTGGGSGIGQATCVALADRGVHVVVVDLNEQSVECTMRLLSSAHSDDHMAVACDVRDDQATQRMTRRVLAAFGSIDILIHCAGILRMKGTSPKPLVDLTTEEWDVILDTNLKGTYLVNRAVLPNMIERRRGHIVNLSSTSGRQAKAHDAAYCASKFGVVGLSEAIAEEVRAHGVKVQVLLPDAVNTPLWEQNGPVPVPPYALSASRVADVIVYLLCMPEDTILVNPVIAPFRTRRRVQKRSTESA
jgi:3-oxoacyl-[acyl-carrier protein] reductase